MVTPIVEIDGTEPTNIIDVKYEKPSGDSIGTAETVVANSSSNRSLAVSGADVEIFEGGDKQWSGEIIGKPSNQQMRNLTLTIEAETLAGQAEHGKVNRPFIELSRAEILRRAINKEIENYTTSRKISFADDTSNWSSESDIFELTNDSSGINNFGRDTIFVGILEGESGSYEVTFDNVPSEAAPGRRIYEFETRMVVNNRGNVFDVYVELVDGDGIGYEWEIPIRGIATWRTYQFDVEDAKITTGNTPHTLRYRFEVQGTLPEHRAAAIDMARATPFTVNDRNTALTYVIDDTDDQITRTVNESILSLADSLAIEAGATVFADENNRLIFESAGDEGALYEIRDDSGTQVVDVTVDRDFDVTNVVTIQGRDDLQATYEDTASVEFYNEQAPRSEPINDGSLRTREQLAARARGYLNDNAWQDSAITFVLAGSVWRNVQVGQSVLIDWPKEDISGTFAIDKTSRTTEGYTTIGVSGQTQINT